ncbi:MAG: hypothetical protein WC451_06490 [Patescibacteria group bacterium]
MNYLKISNNVEIEAGAFTLIGACTKRGDNSKIGYFGSGLKYALAVLLRENVNVKIFSGLKEITIDVEAEIFREKAFNVIRISGVKTNFTTDMGTDWKVWQAIREIYCNALDEGDAECETAAEILPIEGHTHIYIEIDPKIEEVLTHWDRYFCQKRKVHASSRIGQVMFPYETNISLYRKGIRCYDQNTKGLYDYNFEKIDITESRLVKYEFMVYETLALIWGETATKSMIENFIAHCADNSIGDYIESSIWWGYAKMFNQNWIDATKDKMVIPYETAGYYTEKMSPDEYIIVPNLLLKQLIAHFGEEIKTPFKSICKEHWVKEPGKREEYLLSQAKKFFEEVNLAINYPIELVVFQQKNVLAEAKDGKILLSEKVMNLGLKKIVTAIMEECFHLESGFGDETRNFQDHLINQMVTMLENTYGIFL